MTWSSSTSSLLASPERFDAGVRLEALDRIFTALAHASRRQIFLAVHFRGGEMSAGDIARRFHCTWPTISRHLQVLERSGLLSHEKIGRVRMYRVEAQQLDVIREWLAWFEGDKKRGKETKRRAKS